MLIHRTHRRQLRPFTTAFLLLAPFALGVSEALAADTAPTPRTTSRGNLVKVRPPVPQFPPDVKARGDRLWNAASPAVKAWASQNAPQLAKGPGDPEALAHAAAQTRSASTRGGGAADSLAFLLLYEASKGLQASTKSNLDSMSEMGEMESLRLQMAMDRMSKMMQTLSNLMKKMSSSQDAIIQNMK